MVLSKKTEGQYRALLKLQEWSVLIYALAVFLPITISWIALIVLAAAFCSVLACECWRADQLELPHFPPSLKLIKEAPLNLPILIFAVLTFVEGTICGGIKEGFASLFSLRALIIYPLAYQAFRRDGQLLQRACFTLLLVGGLAGIWGAIQQLFAFHPFEKYQYLQASGFMGKPMAYAGQMQIVASLAVGLLISSAYRLLNNQWQKSTWSFGAVTAANLAGIFFASERSGWLGMLVSLLTMSCLVSRKVFLRLSAALIILLSLAWFAVPVVQKRIIPLITNVQSDVSVQARLKVWKVAIDLWKSHPIVGVGPRNFPQLDIPEAVVPGESSYLVHAHSNYLHVLATMGATGLMAFLYLQFSILLVAFRNWRACGNKTIDGAVALGALGGIVSLAVAGLFEYNFGTGHVRLMSWFVLAMLCKRQPLREIEGLPQDGQAQLPEKEQSLQNNQQLLP